MPRKPKYGYARDLFGRVQERDSFKDGAYQVNDYGQSSYDPEDDNGDLDMETFSFNKDGTLSFQEAYVPYDTTNQEYGALIVKAHEGYIRKKKAKEPAIDYSTGNGIEALLLKLKRKGSVIRHKEMEKHLALIDPSFHEYFQRKIAEINQRYK